MYLNFVVIIKNIWTLYYIPVVYIDQAPFWDEVSVDNLVLAIHMRYSYIKISMRLRNMSGQTYQATRTAASARPLSTPPR
jgi:hypothetical protein